MSIINFKASQVGENGKMMQGNGQATTVEEILEKAKNAAIDRYLQDGYARFQKRWARFEPIFDAYLRGHTIGEVSEKFNIKDSHVFKAMKEFGVKRLPDTQLALECARKVARNKSNKEVIKQELENCTCFTCRWVLARVEKIERDQIDTKGDWHRV